MLLRLDPRLTAGILIVLACRTSVAAPPVSPACEPFMPTDSAPRLQDEMLRGLLEETKTEECKFQLRELQSIQKTMDEYRKAGNTLTPTQRASQATLIESSLEATQQLFDRCRNESSSGQIMQAGLDLTSIALFGVLQNNPGAWLVATGVDLVRRLGSVLQSLFTWDNAATRAKHGIQEQVDAQVETSNMQRKMCLYVNYLDAVATLEDPSRQQSIRRECGQVAGQSVCETCEGFDRELRTVLDKLREGTESTNCEVLRWEVSGISPARTELQKIFPRKAPTGGSSRSLLAARVQQLLAMIEKSSPDSSHFRTAWDDLEALATSPTSTCQELAAGWEAFLKRFEPVFTDDEFKYYVGLKQTIDHFNELKNQDSEALSNRVTQLLINVQFAGYAKAKTENLASATDVLEARNDILDRVFKPGSTEKPNCPALGNDLRKVRETLKDIESPYNMCKVLRSREVASGSTLLFGDRVNPVHQSDTMYMQTRDGTRLQPTCSGLEHQLGLMVRQFEHYSTHQARITQHCGPAPSLEWPRSLRGGNPSFRF